MQKTQWVGKTILHNTLINMIPPKKHGSCNIMLQLKTEKVVSTDRNEDEL